MTAFDTSEAEPAGRRHCSVEPPDVLTLRGLRRALDASDSAILVTDAHRRIAYVNDGFTRLLGYSSAEALGRLPAELLMGRHSDPQLTQTIADGLQRRGQAHGEALIYSRSGQPRWVSLVINSCDHPDQGASSISVLTDITLTKMHEVLQKKVLESMVRETPLPELMALVCREVERIAPEVTATILSVDEDGRVHPLAAPSMPAYVGAAIDGLQIGPQAGSCGTAAWRGEPVLVTDIHTDPLWADYRALFAPTGLRACWSSPIKNHQGRVVGTFAFYFQEQRVPDALHHRLVEVCLHLCTVALEREASRQRIHQLAYFDVLTGLPNRTQFRQRAEQALQQLASEQQTGALLYIDLDRFKHINDSQGHAAGDALLRLVAERLLSQLGSQDLPGRLAGDEFVLMLGDCDAERAVQTAQHLLQVLGEPVLLEGQTHTPQASIGIALFPQDGDHIDTLLRHADQAMYQAKSEARHSLMLFSADMNQRTEARAALEQALKHALQQGQLSLHYQPQVNSDATLSLHGVEALMRWQHPAWGWVPPDRFIPVAEESGLIHPMTRWLLDECCRQLAQWRHQGLTVPRVALNLSARSFHQPEFAQLVESALRRHGIAPGDLVLEITESVMMDTRSVTAANLERLHALGLVFSLDDFGTGYSSLSYLHRLPIGELKLDKSFVQDLSTSPTARALTLSVMSLAQSLGKTLVAEGVETREQQDWLQAQGRPVLQGYLFSRPMPATALTAWMQGHTAPVIASPLTPG
ncbi:EAL domain-containing protein [Curvibacter sp. HBC61]|uniref:EAL domain-containing protein n=1 Tax=Curvibacter cyanobacteriorum TaxID=3026422 RepID=A0ABT5MVA5_9BURK|nr:EAL domain-containing protein [Curvibacter sp. HBC61]MDD0837975.1 EAL domain-containing protein [Curvibacter sp. HBC61]